MVISQILANDSSLTFDVTTGKLYRAVEGNFTWAEASSGATSAFLGGASGQLVTIRSQHENDLVQSLAGSLSTAEDVWIGASDQNIEGSWYWYADGVQDDNDLFYSGVNPTGLAPNGAYTNWTSSQPNSFGADEDFARLAHTTGEWRDSDISASTSSYVIE